MQIVKGAAAALALLIAAWAVWDRTAATTNVAFVNYQAITLGGISQANDNPSAVKITELPAECLNDAGHYDMVFVNGMGLRLTAEQREALSVAAAAGTPVLTTMATNPQNDITSTDSASTILLKQYLGGADRRNWRNMLRYVRRHIDGKSLRAPEPEAPREPLAGLLYRPGGDEDLCFDSVAEYEKWLGADPGAPKIIICGHMGVPDSLISALERRGMAVYPVGDMRAFLAGGHADSICASAVINMAHGRLGDPMVEYLRRNNIPLFAPLNANRDYTDWMADRRGMSGGFLSQSVVTPEIDGAIRPYTLFAHFPADDGLPRVQAIPDRLEEFVTTVARHLALRDKPEQDKRIAIFYYKGPGENSLTAQGMDVAPSLLNLLRRLRDEGYATGALPDNPGALAAMAGHVTVERGLFDAWCDSALSEPMRDEAAYADEDGDIDIGCTRLGNVVLIPQPAAGKGDDDFRIVHGTDAAPPREYTCAYLWARYGFGADALMHFGTHGSLEFTPRKQVALGSNDWPDRLTGPLPHIYVYSTSNVGEAMIAKRRTYATIVNYLTPPFMDSGLRATYRNLTDAIAAYDRAESRSDSLTAGRLVKKYTVEMGINRELRLDSVMTSDYTADQIGRIADFADELANRKIAGALYVMGVPYTDRQLRETVEAMAVDAADGERYLKALAESPRAELDAIVNALDGGYTAPSPGGDPLLNPDLLPTGRNMYAINAEATPSEVAWEKGKSLAESTIDMYRREHSDSIPRKVSYTLWSSELIETEGATIAQILYMLGVEPVRDPMGRISDLRLISEEELGRPRIDVVCQTSGQLRDLAASRLCLIGRAVKMAAKAPSSLYSNYVAEGVTESERYLVEKGVSPIEARELAAERVFGGVNGNYGTGIQPMVESTSARYAEGEIAATYMHNMGASYGSEERWEQTRDYAFEAAMTRTDAVVQPRQSNTWGPLSLDHVYEFMGGMNMAVRSVTGKEPEAYLSDYRNRRRVRMQEVKEAIGIESRTTILNPAYISEKMKGGAADIATIASTVRNTFAWNIMKPDAIDDELWDGICDTYVADCNGLGIREHMESVNPAALEEMTRVMLEAARRGMWSASPGRMAALERVHASVAPAAAPDAAGEDSGMVLKKEQVNDPDKSRTDGAARFIAPGVAIAALVLLGVFVTVSRRRRDRRAGRE